MIAKNDRMNWFFSMKLCYYLLHTKISKHYEWLSKEFRCDGKRCECSINESDIERSGLSGRMVKSQANKLKCKNGEIALDH